MYSRSTGEVNSNRVTSSLLRKWTRLPTHAYEVRALTFEVTDNFGSNYVLPCGTYGPCDITAWFTYISHHSTLWSVLCWRNPSQTGSLWQFPSHHSSDNVVCAVLRKPQPDWFTVTVSFQSQQWQCDLCCVEETPARLVYCDSFLPITAVTVWSVLCWRNHTHTSSLWQFPSNHSSDSVVCAVLKKPHSHQFTVTVSFQSQQWQCGLCCVEETTLTPVHCDSFLPVTAATMQFLLLPGPKKWGAPEKTLTTVMIP